jgi:hypothetical protein
MSARNEIRGMIGGVFLVLGMHLLAWLVGVIILTLISYISKDLSLEMGIVALYALLGIGIAQLFYVIPLVMWFQQRRQWGLMKGVIIGAVMTALLNGGCWLIFTANF